MNSSLFGWMVMARMPPFRTFLNSLRRVFLIRPFVVSMTMYWSSLKSLTATIEQTRSPGANSMRLTMALPRPAGPTSGTSRALSQ